MTIKYFKESHQKHDTIKPVGPPIFAQEKIINQTGHHL